MAERKTPTRDGLKIALGVAANTLVEAGHMGAVNAAGYVVPASNTVGLRVMGRIEQTVNNTGGGNGDLSVEILRRKAFKLKNSSTSPVTVADIGGNVMVEDSVTVAHDTTNDIPAGTCIGLEPDGIWVER